MFDLMLQSIEFMAYSGNRVRDAGNRSTNQYDKRKDPVQS